MIVVAGTGALDIYVSRERSTEGRANLDGRQSGTSQGGQRRVDPDRRPHPLRDDGNDPALTTRPGSRSRRGNRTADPTTELIRRTRPAATPATAPPVFPNARPGRRATIPRRVRTTGSTVGPTSLKIDRSPRLNDRGHAGTCWTGRSTFRLCVRVSLDGRIAGTASRPVVDRAFGRFAFRYGGVPGAGQCKSFEGRSWSSRVCSSGWRS
jgi:hypothetical protein